jgi:hypothetical protein
VFWNLLLMNLQAPGPGGLGEAQQEDIMDL